jgi:TRAP-type transport system small permease protein
MREEKPHAGIAEAVSAEGSFHPDGVNTPPFLRGAALALWTGKIRLQRLVLLLCAAALTLLVFVQVVTRYLLGISLFGIEELASFVAVYLYFIGATHGTWERGHISASLVDLILPEGWPQHMMAVVAVIITTVICGWMTLWAWQYLGFVIHRGTVSLETGIPMYWIVAVMPVCLSLMTLYFCVEILLRVRTLMGKGALQ